MTKVLDDIPSIADGLLSAGSLIGGGGGGILLLFK